MNYYRMHNDKTLGPPWQPIAVRYPQDAPTWTPGSAWVLDDLESPHWWLGLPWKGGQKQADSIATYKARLAATRAACPEGTPIVQYAVPCYWYANWGTLSEAKRIQHIEHWCWIADQIGTDQLAVCMYDVYADPDASDGNENAAVELDFQRGRLELAVDVRALGGRKLNVLLSHRQKGMGKSPIGRILTRGEVEPVIGLLNEFHDCIDGVVFWQGDHSWTGCLCNQSVQMSEQAREDMRADWAAETWHPDETPDWTLASIKRVQHMSEANRRAFAGWVYHGTKETT